MKTTIVNTFWWRRLQLYKVVRDSSRMCIPIV